MANQFRTALLMGGLTALLILLGRALGGGQGAILAFAFALLMNLGSWWWSDRLVLAMYGARELSPEAAPQLHAVVERLSQRAGIPKPRLYLIPSPSPNAFATGRSPAHAAVAVTEGAVRLLPLEELEGVLGHELAHVRNRDVLVATLAAALAGAIMFLASWARWAAIFGGWRRDDEEGGGMLELLALAIVAPLAALLIQMAISRSREYLADETGARLCGDPLKLARALQRLEEAAGRIPLRANAATAHLFIVNPLRGDALAALFSTHPPIRERIRRLRAMVGLS